MELAVILAIIGFIFGLGYLFGIVWTKWMETKRIAGTLRIDTSDPDGPYLFLELETGVDEVMRTKVVSFEVSTESYVSRD